MEITVIETIWTLKLITFNVTVHIGGQYRGTFLVPVPSVLLWHRYRGTLLFFGGTGTLVFFIF